MCVYVDITDTYICNFQRIPKQWPMDQLLLELWLHLSSVILSLYLSCPAWAFTFCSVCFPSCPVWSVAMLEPWPYVAMLEYFGAQVESFESPSWRFGWLFGIYVGSCGAQINVWEAQTLQRGGWEGLGLAQGQLGIRI